MSFTVNYQIRLLALLCLDKNLYLQTSSILTKNDFNTFVGQWLLELIYSYYQKHKQLPTRVVFEEERSKDDAGELLPEEQPLYADFLALLSAGKVTEEEYIRETIKKFVSSRRIRNVLGEQAEKIEEGNYTDIITSLRHSQQEISSKESTGGEFTFSLLNLAELYDQEAGIKTGVNLIDQYVEGVMRKELTLIIADSGVGKSLLMGYMGGVMTKNYRKVLHVTLEMSSARVLCRYYAGMAEPSDGISYNNILRAQPLEQVHEYIVRLRDKYEGYLHVKDLPTGKGTVDDIYRLVSEYEPEVVIIDYLDLLRAPQKRDSIRFELKDITTALRGLAVETNTAVVTATQASKLASRRRIVGKELVSEDYEKIRISDTVVTMGQSVDDSLKDEVVMFLAKSRNTIKDKAERYRINYNGMRFLWMRAENLTPGRDVDGN